MRMAFFQIRTTGEKLEEKRKEEVNENCKNARKRKIVGVEKRDTILTTIEDCKRYD